MKGTIHLLLLFVLILIMSSCSTTYNLSNYKRLSGTYSNSNTVGICGSEKFYYPDTLPNGSYRALEGNYKVRRGKVYYIYATYKDGYYYNDVYKVIKKVFTLKKKKVIFKEKYAENGSLIECTNYQSKQEKKRKRKIYTTAVYDRYDSTTTYLKNKMPYLTYFYDGKSKKSIVYKFSSGDLKIKTDIEGFELYDDEVSFNGLSMFVFAKCPSNSFTYDPYEDNKLYKSVIIEIETPTTLKAYYFKLVERSRNYWVYEKAKVVDRK